jgi:hypothetical protein
MKARNKKCRICRQEFIPKYSTMQATCENIECKIEYGVKNKINKVSEKKKKDDKAYYALRDVFLTNHPHCKLNLPGCFLKSTDVHHVHRRGENYLNIKTWMALCRNCHQYVETHPKESREKGWLA